VDADTGRIVASALTDKDVDDGSQAGPVLDQVDGPVASFTGDGAFHQDDVYAEVAARHPDAEAIVPPRGGTAPGPPPGRLPDGGRHARPRRVSPAPRLIGTVRVSMPPGMPDPDWD